MKELFLVNDSPANKISYFHLMAFLASLPFNMFYSHIILASLLVHTLIQFKKGKALPVFTWTNLAIISVFLVTALSTIYSINKPEAYNQLGRHAILLLFPLLFCFNALEVRQYRDKLLLVFSIVCTLTVLYLYATALRTIRFYHLPLGDIFTSHFTHQNFSDPIEMHATFFSMQVAVAFVFLVNSFLRNGLSTSRKIVYAFCIAIMGAGLFQLSSKTVIACVFILVSLVIPIFVLRRGRRLRFIAVVYGLSVIPMMVVLSSDTLRDRYITAFKTDLSHSAYNEGVEPRLVRWQASGELMARSLIIGYGAGSEISLLQEVFFTKKIYFAYLNKLNIHNQYLSFIIKSGIIGLLVYLATLWYGFKIAIKNKDVLLFAAVALIASVSVAENLLDVDKGIIFYAFFFSFFMYSSSRVKMSKVINN